MRSFRIGIDVGGTFTHAVAVDNSTLELAGHQVVPTSHSSKEGVAFGIIQAFSLLNEKLNALCNKTGELGEKDQPCYKIVFLAHSTTQATNALLEGDVAKVGVLGLAQGLEAVKSKKDMDVGSVELSPGKYLNSQLIVLNPSLSDYPEMLKNAISQMQKDGITAAVAAEGFSVDDPTGEKHLLLQLANSSLPACATHQMSGLYGLRVRTRTAVLNASILPKMINTALMTEKALRAQNVDAPLMVMRSDGGVMNLDEVRHRPVMTLLSGPAAGIAACLMFVKASDALFVEVGGTSSDICLIKDGKAALKSASIGGHATYLRTLDSRTLGIAGGSMLSWPQKDNFMMGPRSAHLAGCQYSSFAPLEKLQGKLTVSEVSPLNGDPLYVILQNSTGEKFAVTTTCAANLLGYIEPGSYSSGNLESIKIAFTELVAYFNKKYSLNLTIEELAEKMLNKACDLIEPTYKQIAADYKIEGRAIKLIGGGGGAQAIVPFLAKRLNLKYEVAQHAEVISAIGAALAMVRESLERNILNPTQEDLSNLRREAEEAVIKMGADPDTVEVFVEVDAQKNLVRATATGNVEFVAGDILKGDVTDEQRLATLKESSNDDTDHILHGHTGSYYVYSSHHIEKVLFGLIKRKKETLWITDAKGNVKLQVPGGKLHTEDAKNYMEGLKLVLEQNTSYGDGGAIIPPLYLVAGRKIVDLTSLASAEQVMSLAREELNQTASGEKVYYLIAQPA